MRAPFIVAATSCLVACSDPAPVTAPVDATATDATADTPAPPKDDDVIVVPSDVAPVGDPRSFDVRQRGPFGAGYRLLMHTYTPRGSTTARTIPVHVWYPTRAIRGPHPTYGRFFTDPSAITDAPLAPSVHPMGYPVHVYSHGDRRQYACPSYSRSGQIVHYAKRSRKGLCAGSDAAGHWRPYPQRSETRSKAARRASKPEAELAG